MVIGIDRLILNNIMTTNFEEIKPKKIRLGNNNEISEYMDLKTEFYKLSICECENKTRSYSELDFNPSKVLRGNNIHNSNALDIERALKWITEDLKRRGIFIITSKCKFKYIEINKNMIGKYSDYLEVFSLVGMANSGRSKGFYNYIDNINPENSKVDNTLYIMFGKENKIPCICIYNKTLEQKEVYDNNMEKDLIRFELKLNADSYRRYMRKYNLDNSLETLLKNFDIIKVIFLEKFKYYFFDKVERYIELKLKPRLLKDYAFIKEMNKNIIQKRKELKSKQLKFNHLKINRNIYKMLEEKSWIFDKEFLIDVVIKTRYVNDLKREIKTINEKYSSFDGMSKYQNIKKSMI